MSDALKELARRLSSEDEYERESSVLELAHGRCQALRWLTVSGVHLLRQ